MYFSGGCLFLFLIMKVIHTHSLFGLVSGFFKLKYGSFIKLFETIVDLHTILRNNRERESPFYCFCFLSF